MTKPSTQWELSVPSVFSVVKKLRSIHQDNNVSDVNLVPAPMPIYRTDYITNAADGMIARMRHE